MTDPGAASSTPIPYLIHAYEHRAYPLPEEGTFSIGRDAACDIAVNEVSVSRHHAGIKREGNDFVLSSTGSTNTIMNGVPLTAPTALSEGDAFLIGTMKFVFTRDRLPVAMSIARPVERQSSADNRRPTLTFPSQPAAPEIQSSRRGVWISLAILIVLAVAGYAAYWFVLHRLVR